MADDVFETKEVTPSVTVEKGKAEGDSIDFEFVKVTPDKEEVLETKTEKLAPVSDAKDADSAASTKYQPKALDPKETSYDLTVRSKMKDKVLLERHLRVWPLTGKLTVVDEDGTTPLKGFMFKVVQEGEPLNEYRTSGDKAEKEVPLAAKPFSIEAIPPYERLEVLEEGHEIKIKGKLAFQAEFVAPKSRSGSLRQFINETSTKKGRDQKGPEVVVQIGVKDDRPKAPDKRVGQAGIFAFIEVEFGAAGGTRSKRNNPTAELSAGMNLKDKAANGTNKWKAKVELAGPEGTGEFKLKLGIAGGDNCTVKIGGTSACADATLKLINWRRLYYETIYPSCAEGDLTSIRPAKAKDTGFDFPAGVTAKVRERLGQVFVEYKLYRSHKFTKAEAEAVSKTWTTAAFLKLPGAGDRYYATDFTHQQMADNGVPKTFDGNANPRIMRMKVAHQCLEKAAAKTFNESHTTNPVSLTDANKCFISMNASDGTPSINWADANIKWIANLPAGHGGRAGVDTGQKKGGSASGDTRIVTVKEKFFGKSWPVEFQKPFIGHISTALSETAKQEIKTFIKMFKDNAQIHANGKKLVFEIEGPMDNDRQKARLNAVDDFLRNGCNDVLPYVHPALDAETGQPRSGKITDAMHTFHDINTMRINLPAAKLSDPGSWIDALSDSKAPVKIRLDIVTARRFNGMVWKQHQLVGLRPTATPGAVAATFCHELGHSMGMTIMDGQSKEPPGLTAAKHIDNGGNYYRNAAAADLTKGLRTTHQGSHCANGLSAAEKGNADIGGASGNCILWGAGGDADTRTSYCDTCKEYIKARKLVDLRASWAARADAEY